MAQRITLEEQEKILMHAIGLIREPENFTTGKWKCPVMTTGPRGGVKQAVDDNNRPQFSYCVEGAVNQATYDILGEERAIALGAGSKKGRRFEPTSTRQDGPIELMRLNDLAFAMYAEEMGWNTVARRPRERYALTYNDGRGNHEGVLNLLRGRLGQVRKRLGSKKKRVAA